jgi:hypothetical protein
MILSLKKNPFSLNLKMLFLAFLPLILILLNIWFFANNINRIWPQNNIYNNTYNNIEQKLTSNLNKTISKNTLTKIQKTTLIQKIAQNHSIILTYKANDCLIGKDIPSITLFRFLEKLNSKLSVNEKVNQKNYKSYKTISIEHQNDNENTTLNQSSQLNHLEICGF